MGGVRKPTEMELRVAKAIASVTVSPGDIETAGWVFERMSEEDQTDYLDRARAAIRAMREPTYPMADAGVEALAALHGSRWIYQAMIDAASPPSDNGNAKL